MKYRLGMIFLIISKTRDMKIKFYLDQKLYEGSAQALEKPDEVDFRVDLEGLPIFTIRPCEICGWETKAAVSQDIALSAGLQIEQTENAGFLNIEPGRYYSRGFTGGAEHEIRNGEIHSLEKRLFKSAV